MVFIAALLSLLAGVVFVRLAQQRSRANPEKHLSIWWGTGQQVTPVMTQTMVLTTMLIGAAVFVAIQALSWPGLLVSALCVLPAYTVLHRHNRAIRSQKHS